MTPAISVSGHCDTCGSIIFSQRFKDSPPWRPRDELYATSWRGWLEEQIEEHRRSCPGANLGGLRDVAALVHMGLKAGRIPEPLAAHLQLAIDRLVDEWLCTCGCRRSEHIPRGGANESEHCRHLGGCPKKCQAFVDARL